MPFHQTIIQGNLGGDPELRNLKDGGQVCSFSVAVSEKWTDKAGAKQERTTWYRVSAWDKLADTCAQYLSKGSPVLITGTVSASAYINNAGDAAASLNLTAREVRFIGGRNESADAGDDDASIDDIPF